MKAADLFFIVANLYIATALANTKLAFAIGIFYGLIMLYMTLKNK